MSSERGEQAVMGGAAKSRGERRIGGGVEQGERAESCEETTGEHKPGKKTEVRGRKSRGDNGEGDEGMSQEKRGDDKGRCRTRREKQTKRGSYEK